MDLSVPILSKWTVTTPSPFIIQNRTPLGVASIFHSAILGSPPAPRCKGGEHQEESTPFGIVFFELICAYAGLCALLLPWQVLLRARAIETQCFVLAAAQVGSHHAKRASYGHALAVDPWGTVLGDCGGAEAGVALVEIDMQRLRDTRKDMPVEQHRREATFYSSLD